MEKRGVGGGKREISALCSSLRTTAVLSGRLFVLVHGEGRAAGEHADPGLGAQRARPAPPPPRSDSGSPCAASSQEERCRSEGTEDEGSLELSADDVSRDSTFDSDSDAFSSPFCLSPISEALGKSSSSVFLDSESRDTCDTRMTCSTSSASSLDTSAQFQENNGQTQSTRWDEQQKVFTLEQVCGVFRVDLGQMRSLRLFFSDENCTCGQLVVASRESQYKIFHFHHGGLDKLSEVFQQWKYCTETHLKDQQLSDEKTCMQFSIRRPKLPSAETHPEENSSRRLDVSAWLQHLNQAGQVQEEYRLRKAIFFGGIDISIRGEVWPFLLHYYSYESTSEEREALRLQKRKEYFEIQEKRLSMTPDEQKDFWRQVQFTVDKDVVRTDRSNQFFRGEGNPNVETMRRILLNYAVFNPAIGYSQGMSDLVAPLLAEVLDESDTFWCFVGLMQNTIFISSPRDEDMEKQLLYLRELLRLMHPRFHQHLCALGEDGLQMLFCHRWILLCFKREFPEAEALRMWEACWAHYQTDYFHLFICVAIVVIYGDDVIEQQLATDQMLLHFGNLAMHMSGELVLRKHSVDLSKGCVIIRFSDRPQLPVQARADKSRRANPGAQLAKAAGGQVGMNGASALPPAPRTWQSRCLAPCESGLEGNAVTIHELTFCCYLVLSLACSWLCRPGRSLQPCWGRREQKVSSQTAALESPWWSWRITAGKELLV
uniref:TBC1 domain family member 16 n=1 Tax=Ficedula albicollis TaxID=59894 RepID=U3KCZ9_FICAL